MFRFHDAKDRDEKIVLNSYILFDKDEKSSKIYLGKDNNDKLKLILYKRDKEGKQKNMNLM